MFSSFASHGDVLTCMPRLLRYPGAITQPVVSHVRDLNYDPHNPELKELVQDEVGELLTGPKSRADAQQKNNLKQLLRSDAIHLGEDLHVRDVEVGPSGFPCLI